MSVMVLQYVEERNLMDVLLAIVGKIKGRRNEEDFVDRLNYQYTSYVYAFCAALIMSKQYIGTAIECWTPAEFRKGWIEYARDYCLIENTYWIPLEDPNIPNHEARNKAELPYYQWVQFVLVILAFFFMLPHFFWRSVNWQSGIQIRSIVNTCAKLVGKPDEQKEAVEKVAGHISRAFDNQETGGAARGYIAFLTRWTHGQYISVCYLLTKTLFLFNLCFQLVVLQIFLGHNPLVAFSEGWNSDWKRSGFFPRSTMCDFEIRGKGNIMRYSVQCVLSLNMFNEKIFALLFIWLIFLLCTTIFNTFQWIHLLYSASSRKELAVKMLRAQGIKGPGGLFPSARIQELTGNFNKQPLIDDNENVYSAFVSLTPDQAIVIRLIASNAGDLVCSRLIKELYLSYHRKQAHDQ